jgi:dTDP-4-dehydrorhamnose reductase
MKILLFGGAGQLGYELTKRGTDLNFQVFSPVISEIDIGSVEQTRMITERIRPEIVMNAAAYTAVDKAEAESDEAFRVNRDGARNVALAAKAIGCRCIHVSTDYVFDGLKGSALKETDPTNPQNVYGASKLAGEQLVCEALGERALIVRTSSLHGQRGENFVHTMLKLFDEKEVVKVVSDQIMSPTWAGWLAETLLDLARIPVSGILHASCEGAISWFDFAKAIQEMGTPKLAPAWKARLESIPMTELPRPAKRPPYSAFDTSRLAAVLGRRPIPWQDGLRNHLRDIGRLKS